MATDTVAVGRTRGGRFGLARLAPNSATVDTLEIGPDALAAAVAEHENAGETRWVWADTAATYPSLLAAGIRVARAWDLRLVHGILRSAHAVTDDHGLRAATHWDADPSVPSVGDTLFDLGDAAPGVPDTLDAAIEEYRRQTAAIAASTTPGALRLLCAAESAGALIAVELHAAGVPWSRRTHETLLERELGPRRAGGLPTRIEQTATAVRSALGDPTASLDSQPRLLRALHRAGLMVESTGRWELAEHDHPAVAPLIAYKKLMRLYTANGWAWLDEWVRDDRFRPVYVPAGVVTGRWASSGGGALQIPRSLRTAVRADPGWTLVTADVAQLEPRVLAAMARDTALAEAASGRDLYAGIVERGAVGSRAEAKLAMLGAMYGATTGESGRLLPRLRRTFPRAMQLVDDAARTGEDGGVVHTWLGRTSPSAGEAWRHLQSRASDAAASGADETRARRSARDRGRFTRNFVVQGTAAEWALAWLADLRTRLAALPEVDATRAAPASGPVFERRPHLAFFLHDEIVVHTPVAYAEAVAEAVRESAASAGRLLFGTFPIDFPLDLRIGDTAEKG
ncbi:MULTISPECIES: bifunctional 3'-5' exonuclease/DNA polymerase [Microbacterium]|uniref:bifunctional 3'-5' exonuclease/DNA polymerase n=1 Tax=Microbacterium TaxID=33882 RepID=UPI00278138B6|nr:MULTISPECIES: bifunctional 3'-5' exonuclease/DNA polymerase [Microbacterium]MDQ1084169.1 DNA polymerase-1 [Microbacterium sp. SORGH_AS_0344]MDQ1170556.1 DNA polymerase-1 [Microbacterium proteolyticum]